MEFYNLVENLMKCSEKLYQRGLVVSSGGNISFRLGEKIYITPTGIALDKVNADNLCEVGLNNEIIAGKPSKEYPMHVAVYNKSNANVIIHAHPFYTTAVSSHKNINSSDDIPSYSPGYLYRVGKIGLVDYFKPGSEELAVAVSKEIAKYRCLLLKNHGIIVAANDFDNAFNLVEEIENNCRLYMNYANVLTPIE